MFLDKAQTKTLIMARLRSIDRTYPDTSAIAPAAIKNELGALLSALDSLPTFDHSSGTLQKTDPLEIAVDMVGLRMQQLLSEDSRPGTFFKIQRLAKLAQTIGTERGDGVSNFMDPMDCEPGVVGRYGRNLMANPFPAPPIGAPYGYGENPEGPRFDVNDLYRELAQAIVPIAKARAVEADASIRRDRATELEKLRNIRKEMGLTEDTTDIDRRISKLTKMVSQDDEQPPQPESPPTRSESERDPECEHCGDFPPIVDRGTRVHVTENDGIVPCRTAYITNEAPEDEEEGTHDQV